MKIKTFIAGLFLVSAFILSSGVAAGQDEQEGTFIEESGEKQDSTKQASIFDFSEEYDQEKSSSTGLIIGIAAAVVLAGGVIYLIRKKKTSKA